MEIKPIAKIRTDFPDKFGVPRQGADGKSLYGEIVFENEFSSFEAVRELSQFSHIWLIWGFSEINYTVFHPTVRPPKLGGNKRIGIFSTRSPYRPNSLGLTCVEIIKVNTEKNPISITVKNIDMVDNTPIYDIKPYMPYTDRIEKAYIPSFYENSFEKCEVMFENDTRYILDEFKTNQIADILKNRPQPAYQQNETRLYKMKFDEYEISFTATSRVIKVKEIKKVPENSETNSKKIIPD